MKVNKDALLEYECLKQNGLFSTIKRNYFYDDTLAILVLNMRSFSKNVDKIESDDRIINNDIIGFTGTQILCISFYL